MEEVLKNGAENLKTSQIDDDIQIEREKITNKMKEGGLDDSKTCDEAFLDLSAYIMTFLLSSTKSRSSRT